MNLLFLLPPETAHSLALNTLKFLHKFKFKKKIPYKPCTVMGLDFPNPVGLAAGLDKNAEYIDCLAGLGFGFIEVGTVTPEAQPGNPKPRLFRLRKNQAIINRMGFNNHGIDRLLKNVKAARFNGILGINIGKNFNTPIEEAIDDYLIGLEKAYPFADYITVNISSPNTPGLRQLQQADQLDSMLKALKEAQQELASKHNKYVPLVVKIAPDLTEEEVKDIANTLLASKIDGVIATNTTLSRDNLIRETHINKTGGLSGAPLFTNSTNIIKQLNAILKGKIPIIAVGGIMTAADAEAKLEAGASLVQIYTGLIYKGPELIDEIKKMLDK
ncbi:quinone-dependent dihydroorotate dehydrogenase [Candidatus Marithrix sp. Canyon 246]|nr:quinone-dependent dihydroorotate dehydrogenase [Candidatus Marithrix sp. Canyon 246]